MTRVTQAVEVRLFGAFRAFGASPTLRVDVGDGATVADLRVALETFFPDDDARSLLAASAFATDERMLAEAEPLPPGVEVAVLPPVCGG
jgi:sulfur-carrier protein